MKSPRHLQTRRDARVVTKHVGQGSVGATRRPPGHKLGKRFAKDIVGEGPKLQGAAFAPIGNTGLSNADQAAASINSSGRV